MTVLHLALAADWAAAQERGAYGISTLGRTVAEVGFLHASEDLAQLRGVAERYYRDVTAPLVVLTIDEGRLGVPVVREVPPGETAAHPHVMGEVPVGAVVGVAPWPPAADRLVVRPAERADVPALVALLVEDPLGATRESPGDPAVYVAALERMGGPDNRLVVAELDGRLVGMLQLTIIPGFSRRGAVRSVVEAVRVAAALRGQGIGSQLLSWAVEESRRRGCSLVQLTSDASRADAHRFYERLGFVASHVGFKRQL